MSIEVRPITERAAWLQWRLSDVSASDVAAACGCSPFKSALKLWCEKAGLAPDEAETNLMKRGRHLEAGVIAACREAMPDRHIIQPNVYLRDPDWRLGCTPDAYVLDASHQRIATLQAKLVAKPVFESEWGAGPPIYYQLQALTEAMLAEVPKAILAAYVIGTFSGDLHLYEVQRHASAELRIIGSVERFWRDVEAGVQPASDFARDGQLLALLRPPSKKEPPIDLSRDNYVQELLAERERLMAECSEREDRLTEIKAEILEKLNGSTRATAPGWRISYRMTHRKEHTVAAKSVPVLDIRKVKQEQFA